MEQTLGYRSLQEIVRKRLRDAILKARYQPGDRLSIGAIARTCGVSPIPVREALRSLEAEGLVEFRPNRGVVIKALSLRELRETFLIRIPLECLATREAIPNLREAEFEHLEGLISKMDACANEPDSWLALNQQFHLYLYAAANLPRLYQMLTGLWGVVRPYLRVYITQTADLTQAQSEHRAILEASRRRDIATAARVTEEHLTSTRNVVIAVLQDQLSPDHVLLNDVRIS